ncbi:hypothetical protein SY83_02580 [Paenibacillus swuensis]|uniref:Uncharacterized protein n=2 Tax=Paenibacillus swuensis TaxID=1178515 RepID=A0A172TPJ2_9BACL|nr:hypothetical protein SY83_02580 [Paenibacillus swuensis]
MIVLFIGLTNMFNNYRYKVDHGMKMTVESIAGHSLFMVRSTYDSILENETGTLTIEHIREIHTKLSVIEAYSDTVGRSVNTQLLTPITKDLKTISENMQQSYIENKQFTEADGTKYQTLLKKITALIPLIDKVYYVSDRYGPKVTLNVNHKEELVKFRETLKKYVSTLK